MAAEEQLQQLLVFLGQLTHQVNNYELPDGSKCRDSDATRKKRRRANPKIPQIAISPIGAHGSPKTGDACEAGGKPFNPNDWIKAWYKMHDTKQKSQVGLSKQTRVKHTHELIFQRQEAAFEEWWRDNLAHSLQPRPAEAPTAAQRLEALRERLKAKARE